VKSGENAAAALPPRLWPALALLGFASGLPQPLVDATLSTWLTKAGYSKAELVHVGYVTLPFALKVLWAPLVDRFVPLPGLGRRRGWLLACQLVLALGIAGLACVDPAGGVAPIVLAAALVALASATQDLVVNGYTCDALPPERLAAGAGLSVWGYRVAWLVSGGVALIVADSYGWRAAYGAMAALLSLGALGTWLAPEPAGLTPPATLRAAVVEPLREWRATLGARQLGLLLLFVLLYKLPDGLANLLAVPFQATLYELTSLGLWRSVIGLVGAALGVALAAWATPRLGVLRALFVFGVLQAVSNLGYVGLEQGWWGGLPGLIGVNLVENLCGALAASAFVGYLMSFCSSGSAATQYALLSAVTLLGPHLLREPIVGLQRHVGWSGFFALTALAALPGLLLLLALRGATATPAAAGLPMKGA
jgi:MFS transporter, PAT family, beta-lactamase induction signal transducer AmpG